MPEGPVELSLKDDHLIVRAGRSTTKLPTRAAADFPAVASAPEGSPVIKASVLRRVIGDVRHVIAAGDPSPVRDGTHIKIDNGIVTATASNGHCVARSWESVEGRVAPLDAFVSSAGIAAIARALDAHGDEDVPIACSGGRLFVAGVSVLLYDDKPPPTDVLMAKLSAKHELRFSRAEMVAAIKRAVITADDAKVTIDAAPEGLTVSSGSGTGATTTALSGVAPEGIRIIVASAYLLNQIDRVPDDETVVQLNSADGLAPLVFRSSSYLGVVMPMRL
jgi:DNA polymerase-3 subunit beta